MLFGDGTQLTVLTSGEGHRPSYRSRKHAAAGG